MHKYKTPREYLESDQWNDYHVDVANEYYSINVQQLAKNPVFLDCLRAPKGYKFVQLDFTALEPNVLAEFSGDPCYKEIYASGKPHDVYFFVSCKLLDADGEIAKVYNPENPTKESVAAAKKLFKPERTIGKVFQLMSTYKAGAAAIHRKLLLSGVEITKDEVAEIHRKYWGPDLFGAIKEYDESLVQEVKQRDGWLMNGLGRPLAVTDRKMKDVVNTHTQSTGHDLTDLLILYTEEFAEERGINATPVIPDYHDETIWMCPTEQAEELAKCMSDAVDKINKVVKFGIPLKGTPEICDTFTDFKGPDPVDWYEAKLEGLR